MAETLGLARAAGKEGALDAAIPDIRLQVGTSVAVANEPAVLSFSFVLGTGCGNGRFGSHVRASILVTPVAAEDLVATMADLLRPTRWKNPSAARVEAGFMIDGQAEERLR